MTATATGAPTVREDFAIIRALARRKRDIGSLPC